MIQKYFVCAFIFCGATAFGKTIEPVGYFPADGTGADISVNHHPDASGFFSYETGKAGPAFSFDGVDKYVDLGDWFMQQSFTIGFWMKDNATPAAAQRDGARVGGQYNIREGTDYWALRYTAGHYQVETNNGGSPISFSMSQGAWHYVVLSRDNLNLRVFLDGVLQGSSPGTFADSFGIPSEPSIFNEGIRLGSDRNGQILWKGALDEVRFYDRALGNFEIAALSKPGMDVVVRGTANPYLAGQTTGAVDGDTAPAQAPVAIPVSYPQDLLISASGTVGTAGGIASGSSNGGANLSHAAAHGIASYSGPGGALVGVFLGDSPPSGTAPNGLDYTENGVADPSAQFNSPVIGQVFYIGARQGEGPAAHFYAPQFATRLFLAVIDNGNSDNSGSFSVHVVDSKAGGPYQRTIPGKSNIYGADYSTPTADGFAPPAVSFAAAAGRILTFSGVTGAVRIDTDTSNGGNGPSGPDGGTYQAPINVAASGGLSGFKASSTGALVGVFLAGGVAPTVAPPTLDFTAASSTNFSELSPMLAQVFFIGDGLTADGKPQKFTVPATATGLSLGLADGSTSGGSPGGYANNDGLFEATFQLAGLSDGGQTGTAVLDISATETTTGDPSGLIAHIGEDITYKFHWNNTGSTTARHLQVSAIIPTYIVNSTNLQKQFSLAEHNLSFNGTYGHYVPPSSTTANDAKVVWDVSDLDPGFSQEVEMTLHLDTQVRTLQQIALPNNYAVASTTGQPTAGATGFSSGAANLGVDVRSALRFTATPDVTTVSPGKYINYTLKLENPSPVAVRGAAAVFTLPRFTRFAGFGLNNGVPVAKPAAPMMGALAPHSGSPDEVLIFFGNIGALGSLSVVVTVQAQWVDPAEVPGQMLSLFDYGAALLIDTYSAQFQAAITSPKSTNYYNFIQTPDYSTGLVYGGHTGVNTLLQGSASNGPILTFTKSIKNDANDTLNDGLGNSVDTVDPGDTVTYLFLIANQGKAAAEDVDIQDAMPSNTSYVGESARVLNTTASGKASALTLKQPTQSNGTLSGQHVVFQGLSLAPKDFIILQYQVKVAPATADLPVGSLLTTDSAISPSTGQPVTSTAHTSSSPHTFAGVTLNGPLEVRGKITFAQPRIHPMLPAPEVSLNVSATRTALDAIYKANPNARPLTNPKNQLSFIPGMDRFYVHYENLSSGPVTNVDLVVPIPSHTEFYRAQFVTLSVNPLKNADGGWPGKILTALPLPGILTVPKVPSTGKTVTAHFATLPKGAKGDLMVEVIVKPDAIQKDGSFTGAPTDPKVVMRDNPVKTKTNPHPVTRSSKVEMPALRVMHRAIARASGLPSAGPSAAAIIPTVPEIGVLKIAPTVVNKGDAVEFTFVIFNSGNSKTPACTFQFVQPAGTDFISETHTNLYGGNFVADSASGAVPGTDLECFWNYIPAHSAVAITYTLSAAGVVNVPITDLDDKVLMDFAGELRVTPSPVGVIAPSAFANSDSASTFSVTGHSLHQFSVSGIPVAVIDLGNGQVVINEPVNLYQALGGGGVAEIAFGRSRGVFVGPAKSVGVGGTSAAFMLANRAHGALLGPQAISPATTIVPAGCLEPLLVGQIGAAAGVGLLKLPVLAKVVSNDGGSVVSNDGGSLISQDGAGIVSHDGGGIVSHDGGGIVSHDGGGLISNDGAGLTSLENTVSLIAAGAGNLIVGGGGNLGPIKAGN